MKKKNNALKIVTGIFAVFGIISFIYIGVVHAFNFIVCPRLKDDCDDDDDFCKERVLNDDFFEDEGYFD